MSEIAGRARAYVALGGNLGDPRIELASAIAELRAEGDLSVVAVSSFHHTAPVGGPEGQPEYLNAVLGLDTDKNPEELLRLLLSIEKRHGRDRQREERWGPRRLDLDLLLHGEARVETETLSLPHPRMEERLFVLEPLAEIAPALFLSRCGKTVAERVEELRQARPRPGAPRQAEIEA